MPKHTSLKPNQATRYCIYPGAGAKKLISPIPGPSSDSTWNAICASNGGQPATWYGGVFVEPYSNAFYKIAATLPAGWVVVPTKL